jgi:uncharacterized protein YndB with AHSA1/START domain
MASDTDRIERSVFIKAPRERVWRALANAEEFGNWFGVNLKGQVFVSGQPVEGHITHPGYEHIMFKALVDRVQPPEQLVFRWHPYAIDPAAALFPRGAHHRGVHAERCTGRHAVDRRGIGLRQGACAPPRRGFPHEQRRLGCADGEHR